MLCKSCKMLCTDCAHSAASTTVPSVTSNGPGTAFIPVGSSSGQPHWITEAPQGSVNLVASEAACGRCLEQPYEVLTACCHGLGQQLPGIHIQKA
mmetsp:Transcript_94462/g.293787  ORF Transcript_94462/g.293787 Transcript_94462/m.293787 type:complete len:95 (+) Transcript_94462:2-286(+)